MGGGRRGVSVAVPLWVCVCVLGDEDAPPSHFFCLGLIPQSCPQEKGPADSVLKGPLKRDLSLCTDTPLTNERAPRGIKH